MSLMLRRMDCVADADESESRLVRSAYKKKFSGFGLTLSLT